MGDRNDSLWGKWNRFRKRPAKDRKLILRAALLLPVTALGLRVFGFRRWKELLEKFPPDSDPTPASPPHLQHEKVIPFVRAVRSAQLHGLSTPNCLERSMTLWWMLRRDGIDGELHIGGRKTNGQFEAHAWVELDGEVLNDGAEVHQHYARFDAPIAAAIKAALPAGRAASGTVGKADPN